MAPTFVQETSSRNPAKKPTIVIRPPLFRRGEPVEVASSQEGFVGSYYEGTVVSDLMNNSYVIEYSNLVTDDWSAPLREVVPAVEVRPSPPRVVMKAAEYRRHVVVDAFDNDGWWVGKITGATEDGRYCVFFETTGDVIAYAQDRLRIHQDWVRGKWICGFK